jgi:hypothetical protein
VIIALVGALVCPAAALAADGGPAAEATPTPPAEPPPAPEPTAAEGKKEEKKEEAQAPAPAPAKPAPAPAPAPANKPAAKKAAKPAAAKKVEDKEPEPKKIDERTLRLERDLKAALKRRPLDARQLESLCAGWQPRRVFEDRPVLRARLPLCAARAAFLSDRLDVAKQRVVETLTALRSLPVDDGTVRLRAEALFLHAELGEKALSRFESCGARLGLRRLASFEAQWRSERLAEVVGRYEEVVRAGVTGLARRALFAIGRLYERFYRDVAASLPKTYRTTRLPPPFAIEKVDGRDLVKDRLDPRAAAWPREIARLYGRLMADLKRAGDDPDLLAKVDKHAAAFAAIENLPEEHAENPWLTDLGEGLVRWHARQFERRGADGRWSPAGDEKKVSAGLRAVIDRGIDNVEGAWALVALASSGYPVEVARIEAALSDDDERVQLAGLLAAEQAPRKELYEPLLSYWEKLKVPSGAPLFPSLQRALFGTRERALLAIHRMVDRERDLAAKLVREPRLAVAERAWILGDLGDNRLTPYYQQLQREREPRAAATAIYGHYLAQGHRMLYSARPREGGDVGCVSRNIQLMDRARPRVTDADTNP